MIIEGGQMGNNAISLNIENWTAKSEEDLQIINSNIDDMVELVK